MINSYNQIIKKQFKYFVGLLLILAIVPTCSKAQEGTVKIFSELKGINVYLDDEFKGTDIIALYPVASGSHFLKVVKDEMIVFGELITVTPNAVTTILVKDSKEIQEKLLVGKYKEQEIYKSKKLDILLDTKYITNTTGNTNSIFFPGYYSVSGYSAINTTSTTKTVTDWFIAKGTTIKISQYEFATITDNTKYLEDYKKQVKIAEINNLKTARKMWRQPLIAGVVVTTLGALIFDPEMEMDIDTAFDDETWWPQFLNFNSAMWILGGGGYLIWSILTPVSKYNPNYTPEFNYYTLEEAIMQAKQYNQNLKKELGLPENYEP